MSHSGCCGRLALGGRPASTIVSDDINRQKLDADVNGMSRAGRARSRRPGGAVRIRWRSGHEQQALRAEEQPHREFVFDRPVRCGGNGRWGR